MAYSWAKLWIEMLDDRKTAALPDSSWRRFVECILLAMEINKGGVLPSVPDMAWRLRVTPETMGDDMTRLALAGLVHLNDKDEWAVTNFAKRQAAVPVTERVASHRERRRREKQEEPPIDETPEQRDSNDDVTAELSNGNERVTNRFTDKTRLEETRGEGDQERARVRLHPATAAVMAAPLPPPAVRYEPRDRTPDGFKAANGYHPPAEVEPVKREPSPDALTIGDVANAITEVTGVSAKLVRDDVYALAADLHGAGYTAAQVRTAYSRQATAGAWHWYAVHWKGKKGDPPTLKDIRETIAGATARATATKKPGPIERALAALGNQTPPDPAMA